VFRNACIDAVPAHEVTELIIASRATGRLLCGFAAVMLRL
jgi:hypothetical protein